MGELLTALLLGIILGGITAIWIVGGAFQTRAVRHGAAHWEVAPDGTTTFHWNTPAEVRP